MQRSRGQPLITHSLNGLTRLVWVLGLGTQEDKEYLMSNNAEAGPDLMIKAEAILGVALRDGPLSNFYRLKRLTFEVTLSEASELTLKDIEMRGQCSGECSTHVALSLGQRLPKNVGKI